jgi:hypothetical protein
MWRYYRVIRHLIDSIVYKGGDDPVVPRIDLGRHSRSVDTEIQSVDTEIQSLDKPLVRQRVLPGGSGISTCNGTSHLGLC